MMIRTVLVVTRTVMGGGKDDGGCGKDGGGGGGKDDGGCDKDGGDGWW